MCTGPSSEGIGGAVFSSSLGEATSALRWIGPPLSGGHFTSSLPGIIRNYASSFWGENGVCRLLEPTLGDLHKGSETNRWVTLVSSQQVRTGLEMAAAVEILQSEARECSACLQEELEGPLATPLIAFGEGCTTGYTRKLIVQQREKMRGAVLSKALEQYPHQTARPVWVYP